MACGEGAGVACGGEEEEGGDLVVGGACILVSGREIFLKA